MQQKLQPIYQSTAVTVELFVIFKDYIHNESS
jgi:hypothetical protein